MFCNAASTTELYPLSLHDSLPICARSLSTNATRATASADSAGTAWSSTERRSSARRSEEHTSELQSRQYLLCWLLLEKKTDQILILHPAQNHHSPLFCGIEDVLLL